MFRKAGFDQVDVKLDLNAAEMRRALRDFGGRTREADVAVVYYAGHGIELDGTNYLIPIDAALETDSDVLDETLPLDRALFAVEPARQLRLVILDACRDNPFSKTMKRTIAARAIGRGLAKVEPTSPNTMIAFAAKAGSTASDGDSKNSPFAAEEARAAAAAKARQAEDEKARLAAERANKAEQDKAAAAAKAAEEKRLAAEKAKQVEEAKAAAAEQRRKEAEAAAAKALADKLAAEEALAEKLASDKAAAEAAAKQAATNAEHKVAAVAPSSTPPAMSAQDTTKLVQSELRRVGCLTTSADGDWNAPSQRSLTLFNKYAGTRFDAKLASFDALDAIKAKPGRICPLVCDHGFKADGDACVKITCR